MQKVLGHSKKSSERSYVRNKATATGFKGMDVIVGVTAVVGSSQLEKEPTKEGPLTGKERPVTGKEVTETPKAITPSTGNASDAAEEN